MVEFEPLKGETDTHSVLGKLSTLNRDQDLKFSKKCPKGRRIMKFFIVTLSIFIVEAAIICQNPNDMDRKEAQKPQPTQIFGTKRIAIVTLYDKGYAEIAKYADLNKKAYAKKHNYSLFIYKDKEEWLDPSREAVWNKIPVIQKWLKDYDWVFWTDADALIMNDAIELESLIDENYDIVVPQDFRGINLGNFLVKKSAWTDQFLKEWYLPKNYTKLGFMEQDVFTKLYKKSEDVRAHIKIVPSRVMNSYIAIVCNLAPAQRKECLYQPGDFIVHFAGLPKPNKKNLMQEWYNKTLMLNQPMVSNKSLSSK